MDGGVPWEADTTSVQLTVGMQVFNQLTSFKELQLIF